MTINESLYKEVGLRPADLMPVAMMPTVPNSWTSAGFPAKTVQELISYARPIRERYRSHPRKCTTSHLTAIMFQKLTETTMVHVPYLGLRRTAGFDADTVDIFFDNLGSSISQHQGVCFASCGLRQRAGDVSAEYPT